VVSLKIQRSAAKKLGDRFPKGALTLHMKLEWGDWYVAEVGKTPLSEDKTPTAG
jgi:hypothetical protein